MLSPGTLVAHMESRYPDHQLQKELVLLQEHESVLRGIEFAIGDGEARLALP